MLVTALVASTVMGCGTASPLTVSQPSSPTAPHDEPSRTAPPIELAEIPPAWRDATHVLGEARDQLFSALLAESPLEPEAAAAHLEALAVAVEALGAGPSESAAAFALAGLAVEDVASARSGFSHWCATAPANHPNTLQGIANALREPCPEFTRLADAAYAACRASGDPPLVALCASRTSHPAAPSGFAPLQVEPSTLRFRFVSAALHGDELDELGETVANELAERAGHPVEYISDTRWDFPPTCEVIGSEALRPAAYFVDLEVHEGRRSLRVARPGPGLDARVEARGDARAWLRAARQLVDANENGFGGLPLAGRGATRVDHVGPARILGPVERSLDEAWSVCGARGHFAVVVSVDARGRVVRASAHRVPGLLSDPRTVACVLAALRPHPEAGPERTRARYVFDGEVISGAHVSWSRNIHGPAYGPNEDHPDEPIAVTLQTHTDGTWRRTRARYVREYRQRPLMPPAPAPLTAEDSAWLDRWLSEGVACTLHDDEYMIRLGWRF